ncbi:DUF3883 domain-containing protein [Nitrosopumilus sp.]|nr:DUF3883 domain-containing protein [Nitrosopumilus sp.]
MITSEINQILCIVKQFGVNNNLKIKFTEDIYKRDYSEHNVNFNELLQTCFELKIFKKNNQEISINKNGEKLYDSIMLGENKKQVIDKSLSLQKKLLIEIIKESKIWDNPIVKEVFSRSVIDWAHVDAINKIEIKEMYKIPAMYRQLLQEINLIKAKKGVFLIDNKLSEILSKLRNNHPVTEEDIDEREELKKKIGKLAELECVKKEKERLLNMNEGILSSAVKRVSALDENLGYDIISFTGNNSDLKYDKYIEVKGTKNSKPIIFWSKNEIKVSQEIGNNYYLQIWCNVDSSEIYLYDEIRNPYDEIFLKQKYLKINKECIYKIEFE